MKLETKLDVGDTAYYMKHNKIKNGKVFKITITLSNLVPDLNYDLGLNCYSISEVELFKTKKDLLNSL